MKVSLIVAVYKDIEALELIFQSLKNQTYKNFEVIVAEDGNYENMKNFINKSKKYFDFEIKHTTQEDLGVRKSKSQNNAIRKASGEYLIFIDGDCILYKDFIKNHVLLSKNNAIVTGRRVNLGPKYSKYLREKKISPLELEKSFLFKYFDIKNDAKEERHSEEGFSIKPYGIIHKILQKRRKKLSLLGCNMSMHKKAIYKINGFDEDLGNSAYAGDSDLEWRFEGLGYEIIPARFLANQFHLYHKRSNQDFDRSLFSIIEENKKNKRYVCKNGIKKL